MRILDATLSMDAVVTHKEVNGIRYINETVNGVPTKNVVPFSLGLVSDGMVTESTEKEVGQAAQSDDRRRNDANSEFSSQSLERHLEDITEKILGKPLTLKGSEQIVNSEQKASFSLTSESSSAFSMFIDSTRITRKIDVMDFSSTGNIQTSDGRTVDFSLDLSIKRSEIVYQSIWSQMPLMLDPVVLSFEDGLESLGNTTFSFDLDSDGTKDVINGLSAGSGFLAIDTNGDGAINNGRELFGPQTGHGYNELSFYDNDGNNWIDENDPVFDKLLVWMGAGQEEEKLISLREAGVGALSLGNVDSEFEVKDPMGRVQGQITRSGIFFMENGQVKSMQEIDLAVSQTDKQGGLRKSNTIDTVQRAVAALNELLKSRRSRRSMEQLRMVGVVEQKRSLYEQYWSWYRSENSG